MTISLNRVYKIWMYFINFCRRLQKAKKEIIRWAVIIVLVLISLYITINYLIYSFMNPEQTQTQVIIHLFKTLF